MTKQDIKLGDGSPCLICGYVLCHTKGWEEFYCNHYCCNPCCPEAHETKCIKERFYETKDEEEKKALKLIMKRHLIEMGRII